MSSIPCFYLPPDAWGEEALLDAQETHHLTVLRWDTQHPIKCTDGQGRLGVFRILAVEKKQTRLQRLEENYIPPSPNTAIIALALSKAVRRGFFMEKAVELGAHAVWLWQGENSQGKIEKHTIEAIKRQMIAGAKQCASAWVPHVSAFSTLPDLLTHCADIPNRIWPWEMEKSSSPLSQEMITKPGHTIYVIGPEGGFSNRECAQLKEANFCRVSLGPLVLRCETAAVLCLGFHWLTIVGNQAPAKTIEGVTV